MTRTSLVLQVGVALLFTSVMTFSLFLLFAGHNAPGGGFIGGLVAAAGLVLRFAAHGVDEMRRSVRLAPPAYLGAGLVIAAATGLAPLITGDAFLESFELSASLPVIGKIKTTTALVFDIGVYLVVIGFAIMLLDTLGRDPESQAAPRAEAGS